MKLYNLLSYYAEDISDKYNKLYKRYNFTTLRLLNKLDNLEEPYLLPEKLEKIYSIIFRFFNFSNQTLREKENFIEFNENTKFKDLESLNAHLNFYLDSILSLNLFISRELMDYIKDEQASKIKELKESNKKDLIKIVILFYKLYKTLEYVAGILYRHIKNEEKKKELFLLFKRLPDKMGDIFGRPEIAEKIFPKLDETFFKKFPPIKPKIGLNYVLSSIRREVQLQNKDLRSNKFYFCYNVITNSYFIINYESDTNLMLGNSIIFNFIAILDKNTFTPESLELQIPENKWLLKQQLNNENSILYTLFNIPNIKDKFNKVIFSNPKSFNIPRDKMQNIKIEDIGKLGDLSFE
jgi:hypothetical protein